MHEKFGNGWRAAIYVGSGLREDFGEDTSYRDAMFEVSLHRRGEEVRRICRASEVGKVAEEFCTQFPMASVRYHADGAAGFVARIRCHCEQEKGLDCCMHGGEHHAKVLVVLVGATARPTDVQAAEVGESGARD